MITTLKDFILESKNKPNLQKPTMFNFILGRVYEYDELPTELKREADVNLEGEEGNFDEDNNVHSYYYKAVLLTPDEIAEYIGEDYINSYSDDEYIEELEKDILKNGLKYPTVGSEGTHRKLVYLLLNQSIPHLEMIHKSN